MCVDVSKKKICVDIISSKFGSNFFINRIYSHFYPMITIIPQPQANHSLQ